jgi:hypothetical protein
MQSRELLTSGKLIPRLLLVAGLTSGELRGDRREVPRSTKDQTASCARSDGILFVCPWVPCPWVPSNLKYLSSRPSRQSITADRDGPACGYAPPSPLPLITGPLSGARFSSNARRSTSLRNRRSLSTTATKSPFRRIIAFTNNDAG